jgi:hypothetical protein
MKVPEHYVEYFENEEKGVVVCKLKNCFTVRKCAIDYLNKMGDWAIKDAFAAYSASVDENKQQKIGIAHLADGDIWDSRTGRKVAKTKLETHVSNYFLKVLDSITNDALQVVTYFLTEV